MNKVLLLLVSVLGYVVGLAQSNTQNQNPNHKKSQEYYERVADSINSLQNTTANRTYKAIDYLADKEEAKQQRRENRHDLRMQRARWGYSNWNVGWYPSVGVGYYGSGFGYGYNRAWNRRWIY